MSRIVGQRVGGLIEYEDGSDHPIEFDLEILEMYVDEIAGVAKRQVIGIRSWGGSKLPDGKCWAKFVFEGKARRLLQRMAGGILRNA